MPRRSPAFLLLFGTLATLFAGHQNARPASSGRDRARFVVQFETRGFDLAAYREAIRAHRPPEVVQRLVADLDRRAADDQAAFAAAVRTYGGEVLEHLWLINACTVELPLAALSALQREPNVRRIDRDGGARPGRAPGAGAVPGPTAISVHGADIAHARGFTGTGTALAILDTGQDEDCGGSGSPHPIYRGSDGHSRLVHNVRCGSEPCDDRIGHGTAVAAIAAGAAWDAPGAAPGHAPEAAIAGYAVADRADGAASDCAILAAWQQVARDRTELHLIGANHSYSGSPDPTSAVQQALDSAAYNADLLVTVCAYNTGAAGTGHSQSACNGLAVGAVTAGDLTVCGYSARGPMLLDDRRTYPDLCAVADTIGPNPDCEHSAGSWFGTSFAAPQVLGAAALVRQAAPELTALETKAVLLASTLDLDAANPGLGRNATGAGLLHDDCAVATALDPRRCRTVVVDGTRPVRIAIDATAGEPMAAAITWHRTEFTSADWADIDLRIVDGLGDGSDNDALGVGCSPRNLYEHVRFVPRHTGIVVAELLPRHLPHGPVEVAFAAAALPLPTMLATYRSFGAPCAGSALRPGHTVQAHNGSATVLDLARDFHTLSATEWLFEFTADDAFAISGFEALLGLADGPADLRTAVYLADGAGAPLPLPAAVSAMAVGRQPGWVATRFLDPVAVARGQRYFLAFKPPAGGRFTFALQRGTKVHARYRWPCGTDYADGGSAPAGLRVLGGPPAPGLEPQLGNRGVPELGGAFAALVSQLAPRAPVLLATAVESLARPLDLGPVGAPGCSAYVQPQTVTAASADQNGRVELPFALPADAVLRGFTFVQQAFAIDPAANALGLSATHAARGRVGDGAGDGDGDRAGADR